MTSASSSDLPVAKRELGDQDLAGLGDHALLAGRQALLSIADREVPQHLSHLVRVTGVELLEVVLEPTAPVGGHGTLVLGEHLEDLLGLVLAHTGPEADLVGRIGRDKHGKVAVDDAQYQVLALLAEEFLLAYFFTTAAPCSGCTTVSPFLNATNPPRKK